MGGRRVEGGGGGWWLCVEMVRLIAPRAKLLLCVVVFCNGPTKTGMLKGRMDDGVSFVWRRGLLGGGPGRGGGQGLLVCVS